MDGVQRNFSKMAEKIDRMRCLRERCDNYVRLIKLTLDEKIQEQNSLLDGSSIYNRLKYLGILDKPITSSNTFNINKIYPKRIDIADKYKYLEFDDYLGIKHPEKETIYPKRIDFADKYKYLEFDDHLGIRRPKKEPNFSKNDMYLSNNKYTNYNSNNYKPRVPEISTAVYEEHNNSYYTPISSKKYGNTMNFPTPYPQEYQVYYFPTSNPIAQYPRHTTEQFYTRKPIKQYPLEEASYWPTRYQKPIRVIEREPSYPIIDLDYRSTNNYRIGNKNIDHYYTPEYRTNYLPSNPNVYYGYDDNNYYEPDLRHRSYSSITRPCSPVYTRNNLYDRQPENYGSLLEKKIRDYVWKPHKERDEKYVYPNYEKSIYYTDFKPLHNKYQGDEVFRTRPSLGLESHVRNRKNELNRENSYKRESVMTLPEIERPSNNEILQTRKDDDNSECSSYKTKSETPVHFPKRISFDLGDENIEVSKHNDSVRESFDENPVLKERESILGRRESSAKLDDERRTSLLSSDGYSILNSKQRISPSDKSRNSSGESFSKLEKLPSKENSFESDKYSNLKNSIQENNLNSFEKNERVLDYNNTIENEANYNHSNSNKLYSKENYEKNNDMLKNISNGNAQRDHRRDSNDSLKRKLIGKPEKPKLDYQSRTENKSNKRDSPSVTERRESYKNDKNLKNINVSNSRRNSKLIDSVLENEFNSYQSGVNKYNTNEQKTDRQQFINYDDNVKNENNSLITASYHKNNDLNERTGIKNDSLILEATPNEQESSQEILNDNFINNTNNFHIKETNEYLTREYETQPAPVDEHIANDELADEIVTNSLDDQHKEFVDQNSVHDEYYHQNPAENPIENPYKNPEHQENYDDKQQENGDYYYQNYSNSDPKGQVENQYAESSHQGEYSGEHVEQDDYYYQNNARDDTKDQQAEQQYVDPNYQENYIDQQQANDDYYYQNYSNVDPKDQPENPYTESNHLQTEYAAEHNEHDDYYYQNHPSDDTNENQVNQNYGEPEHQGEYANGEQDNYYYENNSNVNAEQPPLDHFDEHGQQEGYAQEQNNVSDGYYYQKPDKNYDGSIPKDQYDGYVDNQQHQENYDDSIPKEQYDNYANNQQNAIDSYYPDEQNNSNNNYDPQQSYENDGYQTQQSEYVQPYEQNPNNENYGYSDNIDEIPLTNQISDEQSKQ